MRHYNLLTIDLSMFGEGGAAPAGGEGGAPAAAEAPAAAPEVRYGKQPDATEQTAQPQQAQNPQQDKAKAFKDLIKGEYKAEYTEATQQLINRRFRDTDAKIQAQQPIIDTLSQRYGITDGDMGKLLAAIEGDTAYWQEAADNAGMTVEQYQKFRKLDMQNRRLQSIQEEQQRQFLANRQYAQWEQEAETVKQQYPEFDLQEAQQNEMFMTLLRNRFPMAEAYRSAFSERIVANAIVSAQKSVTENIKARGSRPAEAGVNSTPAYTVKDDVSKLTDQDVLAILGQIGGRNRISFG